jgi:hypothetical protein
MPESPKRTEEEIAREYVEGLVREFTRKRLTSIMLCVIFFLLVVLALMYRLPMLAFCCLMVVLIGAIRYWDATGQVEDARRLPTKFLHAPISVLDSARKPPTINPGIKT